MPDGVNLSPAGLARDELFLTTKIWIANVAHDTLLESLREWLPPESVEVIYP